MFLPHFECNWNNFVVHLKAELCILTHNSSRRILNMAGILFFLIPTQDIMKRNYSGITRYREKIVILICEIKLCNFISQHTKAARVHCY